MIVYVRVLKFENGREGVGRAVFLGLLMNNQHLYLFVSVGLKIA